MPLMPGLAERPDLGFALDVETGRIARIVLEGRRPRRRSALLRPGVDRARLDRRPGDRVLPARDGARSEASKVRTVTYC